MAVAQLVGFEKILPSVVASNEERGTMTCRLLAGPAELETPLVRANAGSTRSWYSRGRPALVTEPPRGLSAQYHCGTCERSNGGMSSFGRSGLSGAEFEVHLMLAARESLQLARERSGGGGEDALVSSDVRLANYLFQGPLPLLFPTRPATHCPRYSFET
jgi:hypothetical protein